MWLIVLDVNNKAFTFDNFRNSILRQTNRYSKEKFTDIFLNFHFNSFLGRMFSKSVFEFKKEQFQILYYFGDLHITPDFW